MKLIFSILSGVLFGAGLALSGMTDRTKVIGFLDVAGNWQLELAFVMAAALLVSLPSFVLILKRQRPICDKRFYLPEATCIDGRLLIGAGIFGVGWGLYGFCPGPAITSLIYLKTDSFIFVFSMSVGMVLAKYIAKRSRNF